MTHTVIMPKLGQTVEESTIVAWRKREGETVAKGDILFDIETDKAVLEVESFFEGTLLKILVPEGRAVPVSAPVAFIGAPGDPLPDLPPAPPVPAPHPAPAPASLPASVPARAPDLRAAPAPIPAPPGPPPPGAPVRRAVSPRARRLLREKAVRADAIPGTGPGGRVVEQDVRAWLEARGYDALRITPAALNLARAEGLDVLTLTPEPGDPRITVNTVRDAIAERPAPLSRMRQVIAERLTASYTTAPHFFVTVSADMTDLLELRSRLKRDGRLVSITGFILKATALALSEFQPLNSMTPDGRTVHRRRRVHLGFAVEVPEGLVVPVLRDAHLLTLAELHDRAAALTAKAREGRLTPADMSGGTFTVSNMGMLAVEQFTAIINPGESGILAVSSILPTPAATGRTVTIRQLMKMTLSSDHRLVDGATAARFVNRVKALLEDIPAWTAMI